MKNSHRGFIVPLLLVLIAVLLFGGGAYLYTQNQRSTNISSNLPKVTHNLPKLMLHEATHFTIELPEGWAVGTASESGDMVSFFNQKEPTTYVIVTTFKVNTQVGNWPKMEERWQFSGRNPATFEGADGREGIAAEGVRLSDPTKQILAVGYRINDKWDMIAEAGASKEQFESMKPLFTAILKSLKPDPAALYGMEHL